MARDMFSIEKGFRIYKENSDTLFIDLIFDSGAPLGTSGETDAASIGSIYTNSSNGAIYKKITDTSSAGDWVELASASVGNWRSERVDALTGDDLAAGSTNPTTWTDNDDGTAAASFTVGNYVLDGAFDLWEITAISAPNITLAAAATAPAADDMFAVKYYMPDVAGQENQAIVNYTGSAYAKVADVDFAELDGISTSAAYLAGSSTVTKATTAIAASQEAELAVEILDDRTMIKTATGVTTLTNLDVVLVDEVRSCVWEVTAFEEATPANVKSMIVHAANNGTSGADANSIDDSVYSSLKIGSNFNLQVSVGLTGSGATQGMSLNIVSSTAGVTVTSRRMGVAPSGY